jgi:hypothetical protein
MSKYEYLKKYQAPHDHIIETWHENSFIPVNLESIKKVEDNINIKFSEDLKEFWIEVGGGNLTTPIEPEIGYDCFYSNNLLFPGEIASILTKCSESGLITPEGMEFLKEGDIPFFEIADHVSYLVMRPNSDHPNAVYTTRGQIIEDSLETFIWKLYHVSPTYYLDKL